MSAPLLWIGLPLGVALILILLSRWERLTIGLGILLALALAAAALFLEIGAVIAAGPIRFVLSPSFVILGRSLSLTPNLQPLLTLIYLLAAFWFTGITAVRPGRLSVPLGLGVVALLVAALAVQPFLYAALLIEMAVLLCVPLLVQPGSSVARGILRFVTFQTFGMPFILFTGHLLAGIESNPGDPLLSMRVGILMGLGFSFLLAIFPFHTWLPMLGESVHPYLAAFVFVILPQMVLLFGLGFLERFAWMQTIPAVFTVLLGVSLLMIAMGSLWAIFQSHLGRLLGYAAMSEIGFALLALALLASTESALWLHFSLIPARTFAFGVAGLSLSVLRMHTGSLHLDSLRGWAYRLPFASLGLLIALLTWAGLPLLAAFPPRFALMIALADGGLNAAWLTLLGGLGYFLIALRTFTALFWHPDEERPAWRSFESRAERLLLGLGVLALFGLGLASQWVLPWMQEILTAFPLLR